MSVCLVPLEAVFRRQLPAVVHANTTADRDVAERSILIKNLLEDVGDEAMTEAVPLPNVSPLLTVISLTKLTRGFKVNEPVLQKVMEWCTHHRGDPPATTDDDADSRKKTTDIDEWDQKFMQVDQEMLFEIILVRLFYPLKPIPWS